jgi:5-dehydro-2-deoxygluconokinase
MALEPRLDVITIGRSSVDLYGAQVGGRLEDMASFSKAVGGCPTNIAIGTARLGLKSGLITRVGDEHMGRFIREQCAREGVDVTGVKTDPVRLTALVLLGIRDEKTFPLIFYRENCADGALDESDIDPSYIESAKAVLVSGTHFARANTAAAQRKAMGIARASERKVVFDIDYRPNLWGLAGHGAGEERYIKSGEVTKSLSDILPQCDLIVGTEEEMMIAGGADDPLAALKAVRAASQATLVLKRGPMGCVVFPGAIPDSLDEGVKGPGFPVEVYNVLGAGDAFMSGFLRGWLTDEPLETCCAYANANGAFAVSRLLCSAEYPTWAELSRFLKHGSPHRALRRDETLNHIHWATTRRSEAPTIMALAIDHRAQLEKIADAESAPRERISDFKLLAVAAAAKVAAGRPGYGMLLDGKYGREALFRAVDHGFWIGRPVEEPGSRPLAFESGGSLGARLVEWPVAHTIKCLCFYHPDDPPEMKAQQERELLRLHDAARRLERELLIEIIASKNGPVDESTVARVIERLYEIGIQPDWWKLEGQPSKTGWENVARAIEAGDPLCRGVLLLGLEAAEKDLAQAFALAHNCRVVKGFAVGRTIFAEPAAAWFAGRIDDREATDRMAAAFARLGDLWRKTVRITREAETGTPPTDKH